MGDSCANLCKFSKNVFRGISIAYESVTDPCNKFNQRRQPRRMDGRLTNWEAMPREGKNAKKCKIGKRRKTEIKRCIRRVFFDGIKNEKEGNEKGAQSLELLY